MFWNVDEMKNKQCRASLIVSGVVILLILIETKDLVETMETKAWCFISENSGFFHSGGRGTSEKGRLSFFIQNLLGLFFAFRV